MSLLWIRSTVFISIVVFLGLASAASGAPKASPLKPFPSVIVERGTRQSIREAAVAALQLARNDSRGRAVLVDAKTGRKVFIRKSKSADEIATRFSAAINGRYRIPRARKPPLGYANKWEKLGQQTLGRMRVDQGKVTVIPAAQLALVEIVEVLAAGASPTAH